MTVANSSPLPQFNIGQTFLIDTSLAPLGDTVALTSINLYFKYKPAANNNASGMTNPGITMYITPTIYQVPQITTNSLTQFARCEYNSIVTSSDGSAPTNFLFTTPVLVQTGQMYAFILSFDGNEIFYPWAATTGQQLVGTTTVYTSPGNPDVGNYYQYVSSSGDTTNNPENASTQAQYLSFWSPVQGSTLTFDVFAARYFIDGIPVSFSNAITATTPIYGNNIQQNWNASTKTLTISYPSNPVEGVAFNLSQSTVQQFIGAQRVYQNTVSYPGGFANGSSYVTVSTTSGNTIVTANSNLPNGQAFNWNSIFPSFAKNFNFITLQDVSGPNVRRVLGIANTTSIVVDEPVTFTNNIAQFFVSPVGTVDSVLSSSPYGKQDEFLFLNGSSANATVRFVNNQILSITPSGSSNGYSNTDILYIMGYEYVANKVTGGYVAVANIVTNASGGIIATYLSNQGCGFVNSTAVVAIVANSVAGAPSSNTTANTSSGTGAIFTYTIGATLCTEMTTNIFQNCIISNFNIDDVYPVANVFNPLGTTYDITLSSQYYLKVDNSTYSGFAYYVEHPVQSFDVVFSELEPLVSNNPVCFISYSNEYVTPYSNGSTNDQVTPGTGYSNSITVNINQTTNANDDYIAVNVLSTPVIEFGHYTVNDSYYLENTNSGNAWAKHLTTLINFNQFAEDLRLYLTVYQPINTGFQVFAKIQNSNDPESFSSEEWTLLQQISGQGLISSTTDPTNYVELGYGFNMYEIAGTSLGPNTTVTLANTVITTNASANVTTAGGFNAAGIVANTLVRIYPALFSNADFYEALVTAVANDTFLTLDTAISSNVDIGGNPALVGAGLSLDILGYPHQAFNNTLNDNVVRYYSTSFQRFDGYNNLQIKVVFLSSSYSYIPELNSIRLLGLTA